MKPTLDAEKVDAIFMDCLFKDGEPTEPNVTVEGVVRTYGLHPERVDSHRDEIKALLDELPPGFTRSKGGGWSFLNACDDKNGHQWTGLHARMEQLFVLGMAIGCVQCLMPRDMWEWLPGGMPYYVIDDAGSPEG